MHDKGVSHRDLKPENILLDSSGKYLSQEFYVIRRLCKFAESNLTHQLGTLKISDFGLATVFRHGGRTRPLETPCGSAPYVAPEV